jgi:hypothetical protein
MIKIEVADVDQAYILCHVQIFYMGACYGENK